MFDGKKKYSDKIRALVHQSTRNYTIPKCSLPPSFRQLIIQRIYVITLCNRGNRNSLSLNTNSSIAMPIVTLVKPLRYKNFSLVAPEPRFLPSSSFLLSYLCYSAFSLVPLLPRFMIFLLLIGRSLPSCHLAR